MNLIIAVAIFSSSFQSFGEGERREAGAKSGGWEVMSLTLHKNVISYSSVKRTNPGTSGLKYTYMYIEIQGRRQE